MVGVYLPISRRFRLFLGGVNLFPGGLLLFLGGVLLFSGGVDTSISRWWAERQVNEILAEHPGELVRTGWEKMIPRFCPILCSLYTSRHVCSCFYFNHLTSPARLQVPPIFSALPFQVTGGQTRLCPWLSKWGFFISYIVFCDLLLQ